MARRPTLRTIADQVGVTVSAVSLALRDDPRISQGTRDRIQQAAQALGYVYNRHAAGLRRGDSGTVAVCLNDLGNPFFTEFLGHMETRFREANRMMLFGHAQETLALQTRFTRQMVEHGAAGLVLLPVAGTTREDLEGPEAYHLRHFPLVLISRDVEEAEFDRVINDDVLGMKLLVQHLLALGHRRIVWLGGGSKTSTARDREAAFIEEMTRAGLPPAEASIHHGPTSLAFGDSMLDELMGQSLPPTAMVCFSDIIAFGVLAGCYRHGLTPGVDISVTGFDDMGAAAYSTPALTSVRVRTDLIGARASELLLARMAGHEFSPVRAVIPPELIVRATTGPPVPGQV
ncbi:LacI family DNA-binding transcriptional regulator [Kushneria phosphatilytica]|uniref:LacI family DNA-binding transcriptional regulator n=1 Tax=Kushneria phosphatilytica TaxID=657387 RepID=A0A1S1NT90_9GAMM|nr:LacI family DNA-binding transcriptional regulator [Kushneria phosphatilytica]OHV08823.1 LacI family transcriptional regulator [Kushneria phosphatilytica]QEL12543.1 LacI family DNA-binding transcriptional regulator [Kushneria phosphatilytica]